MAGGPLAHPVRVAFDAHPAIVPGSFVERLTVCRFNDCGLLSTSEQLGTMAGYPTLWQAGVSEGERRLTTERGALAQVCKEAVTAVTDAHASGLIPTAALCAVCKVCPAEPIKPRLCSAIIECLNRAYSQLSSIFIGFVNFVSC